MSRQSKFDLKLPGGYFIIKVILIGIFAKDNGSLINWQNASSYCQSYRSGGHTDWRMPTLAELASLYEPEAKNKHGYHVNKLIDISAASCWASDTRDYEAARFNFTYGEVYWLRKSFSGPSRVLPVRSSK